MAAFHSFSLLKLPQTHCIVGKVAGQSLFTRRRQQYFSNTRQNDALTNAPNTARFYGEKRLLLVYKENKLNHQKQVTKMMVIFIFLQFIMSLFIIVISSSHRNGGHSL